MGEWQDSGSKCVCVCVCEDSRLGGLRAATSQQELKEEEKKRRRRRRRGGERQSTAKQIRILTASTEWREREEMRGWFKGQEWVVKGWGGITIAERQSHTEGEE